MTVGRRDREEHEERCTEDPCPHDLYHGALVSDLLSPTDGPHPVPRLYELGSLGLEAETGAPPEPGGGEENRVEDAGDSRRGDG